MKISKVIFWFLLLGFLTISTACNYGSRENRSGAVPESSAKGKPTMAVFYSEG